MKKLMLAIIIIMYMSLPANAYADIPILSDGIPGQGIIKNPVEYWETNGYPDNISFAFEGGSMLENEINYSFWIIGIINDGKTNKQEIIDLFSPHCLVTFENSTYSYNERKAAYDGMLAMQDENIFDVIYMKNTDEVVVVVSEENFDRYTEILPAQFGGMVRVSDGSDIGINTQAGGDNLLPPNIPNIITLENTTNLYFWIVSAIVIFLCGTIAMMFVRRIRLTRVMQTNNGNAITENTTSNKI
jgi:hypothetical protein